MSREMFCINCGGMAGLGCVEHSQIPSAEMRGVSVFECCKDGDQQQFGIVINGKLLMEADGMHNKAWCGNALAAADLFAQINLSTPADEWLVKYGTLTVTPHLILGGEKMKGLLREAHLEVQNFAANLTTLGEVAKILRRSPKQVLKYVASGVLEAEIVDGDSSVFDARKVRAFISTRRTTRKRTA